MKNRINYEAIKDAVQYGFDEYTSIDNFNNCQAAAKILEEDWREVNYNTFTKKSYILNIAIESLRRGEIADFIFEKTKEITTAEIFDGIQEEELLLYRQDIGSFQQMEVLVEYTVVETSCDAQSRVEYLLSLENRTTD